MAFCFKCGAQMDENAAFCSACGAANPTVSQKSERVQEFSGKIVKCPNCGDVLKSLSAVCPTCGFELRSVSANDSIKEFSNSIQKTPNLDQKLELIKNFPIPNSKEDIFDFFLLAISNFDGKKYVHGNANEKAVAVAWYAKIQQSYTKAEMLFKNDPDFSKIDSIYRDGIKEMELAQNEKLGKLYQIIGYVLMGVAAYIFFLVLSASGLAANPRMSLVALGFALTGFLSFLYSKNPKFLLPMQISYIVNVIFNAGCCFWVPGQFMLVIVFVACGIKAFFRNKTEVK